MHDGGIIMRSFLFFMEHWKNISLENISEEIDGILCIEKWKPISGYEKFYKVSNFGRVKSLKRIIKLGQGRIRKMNDKILKLHMVPKGYLQVALFKYGEKKIFSVHRLVGTYFLENPYNKPEVNHKIGIKHDNRFLKLEWVTKSENEKDAYDKGLKTGNIGEKCPTSILTEKNVLEILLSPLKNEEIAKIYGTTRKNVWQIRTGKRWKHLTNKTKS